MFRQKKTNSFISSFSYNFKSLLLESKFRIIITSILLVLGIIIGVFVAVRLKSQGILDQAKNYGFVDFSLVKISSISSFIWRFLSVLIITGLLTIFSLTIFVYPIAEIVLVYRSYLIGLNITIIIMATGLGGLFTSILILLPCQLLSISILGLYFCLFSKQVKSCASKKEKFKTILLSIVCLLVVDIVESLLLAMFGANVILVI